MGVSAAARDPPTAAAAVQRVAEESEELGRILRIEARPLKQAVGGSCGEDIGRPALPSTYKHTPRSFWAHPDGSAVDTGLSILYRGD